MRKAFLRAPVEFSRISSNFNLKRVHPLFKRSMPHRGIDYVAPVGTPVLASGDGKVMTASRTQANGNYVVIQHGEQFRLQVQREFADLIQEHGAVLGCLDESGALFVGAGEGPLFMAEKLRFDQ